MTDRPIGRVDSFLGVSGPARRRALLVAAVFLGTQSTHALAATTADTLFFSRFGVEHLPTMYIALGLITMVVLLGYGVALGKMPRTTLYPWLVAAAACGLLLSRLVIGLDQQWVYAFVWLVAMVGVLVTFAFMWNLASDAADARTAKRLFPVFASAGILGGVIGSLMVGPLTSWLGAPNVFLVTAVVLAGTAVVAYGAATTLTVGAASPRHPARLRDTLGSALHNPLLRLVAVAFFVGSALFYAVAFPFSTEVAEAFDTEAEIASYLGVFAAAATAVTFFVSLFLVNRIFSRLGVVLAWFLVGVVYVLGFTMWLIALTLATASLFRFVQWVMAASVGGTAASAMFNVVRPARRAALLAAYAAVPAQLGVVLAGVLLWAGSRLGERTNSVIGLVLALVLAGAIWRMRSHYAEALVEALEDGRVEAFVGPNPGVAQLEAPGEGVDVALAALDDPSPDVRRLGVEMLGRLGATEHYDLVVAMLGDDDVGVRLASLETMDAMAAARPDDPGLHPPAERVIAALGDGSASSLGGAPSELQAQAVRWLVGAGREDAATEMVEEMLDSAQASERRAAAVAMADAGWEPHQGAAGALLIGDDSQAVRAEAAGAEAAVHGASALLANAFLDGSPRVRFAVGEAWARSGGDPGTPVGILEQQPSWAWEAATVAIGERAPEVGQRVLRWAGDQLELLAGLRRQHQAIAAGVDGHDMPAGRYLEFLTGEWVAASQRIAVRLLGLLESEETVRLVIAGIRSSDPETRAQALEAAEGFGGALGRRVVPLIEGERIVGPPLRDVLRGLVADADPYVRALAVRFIMELAARELSAVVRPLVADPDPMVADIAGDVVARMDVDMAESLSTLSRMERMLLLRRVSIFQELIPDDLDRLAQLAAERVYESGEVVLARGEVDGDLVVIVEGSLDIGPAGGTPLQRLGPGDHVGELTAMSGRPRPTDATAVGTVRVLAITSAAFSDLMLDRPEVARLMLAALAGRLADALGYEEAGTGGDG